MRKLHRVHLTAAERADPERRIATGRSSARALSHARILLHADESPAGPARTDAAIAAAVRVSVPTTERVRRLFVEEGLDRALAGRPRQTPPLAKLDGHQEAQLLALACSAPPDGYARWTLRLLARRLVELAYVDDLSYETVRRVLKKTRSSPSGAASGASHLARMPSSSLPWKRS